MLCLLILFHYLDGGECTELKSQKSSKELELLSIKNDANILTQVELENHKIQSKTIGTSLRVLLLDKEPFTFRNTDGAYDGIEVRLLEQIAKELKIKIKYYFRTGYGNNNTFRFDFSEYFVVQYCVSLYRPR